MHRVDIVDTSHAMSRPWKMWVGLMGKLQTIVDSRLLPGTQSLYRAKGKLKNNGTVYRSF